MNYLMDAVMNPFIDLWFDQSVKMIRYFFFAVYFYSPNLDNLKWKPVVTCFLSRRILIPFQVKDNIVHSSGPFCLLLFRIYFPLLTNILFHNLQFILSGSQTNLLCLIQCCLPFNVRVGIFEMVVVAMPVRFCQVFSKLAVLDRSCFQKT